MVKRVVNPAFLLLISLPIALVLNVFILLNDPVVVAPHHVNMTGENAYFRPSGDEVSGFKNSLVKNHRSPCPALNALANHGYLPRDGKEVTPRLLQRALVKVYNLDASLAEFLVSTLPAQFTLADLGEHHFIELDALLVHDDDALVLSVPFSSLPKLLITPESVFVSLKKNGRSQIGGLWAREFESILPLEIHLSCRLRKQMTIRLHRFSIGAIQFQMMNLFSRLGGPPSDQDVQRASDFSLLRRILVLLYRLFQCDQDVRDNERAVLLG
jgi:hypothetical protein